MVQKASDKEWGKGNRKGKRRINIHRENINNMICMNTHNKCIVVK